METARLEECEAEETTEVEEAGLTIESTAESETAKISIHRSSFDLSSKKLFTAKVGEILPCYWQIAIPGNKYQISSDWFTRTVPVNTAAYTRIKEYYDFYAVPLRLIL